VYEKAARGLEKGAEEFTEDETPTGETEDIDKKKGKFIQQKGERVASTGGKFRVDRDQIIADSMEFPFVKGLLGDQQVSAICLESEEFLQMYEQQTDQTTVFDIQEDSLNDTLQNQFIEPDDSCDELEPTIDSYQAELQEKMSDE
jgi:hypothetical protein